MEGFLLRPAGGDGAGRCRRHPSAQHRSGGVCPECLHARLLRLCPDCAGERSHGCSCPSTSSAAASAAPVSSLPSSFSPVAPGSGSVGLASHPVRSEPAFQRSRSAAPRRLRARLDEAAGCDAPAPHQTRGGRDGAAAAQAHGGVGGWAWLWPFLKAKKTDRGKVKRAGAAVPATGLPRSRSVGGVPGAYPPDHGRGAARCNGWSRYLPISMKSFRRTSKVVQARSPSAVAE